MSLVCWLMRRRSLDDLTLACVFRVLTLMKRIKSFLYLKTNSFEVFNLKFKAWWFEVSREKRNDDLKIMLAVIDKKNCCSQSTISEIFETSKMWVHLKWNIYDDSGHLIQFWEGVSAIWMLSLSSLALALSNIVCFNSSQWILKNYNMWWLEENSSSSARDFPRTLQTLSRKKPQLCMLESIRKYLSQKPVESAYRGAVNATENRAVIFGAQPSQKTVSNFLIVKYTVAFVV